MTRISNSSNVFCYEYGYQIKQGVKLDLCIRPEFQNEPWQHIQLWELILKKLKNQLHVNIT